MQTKAFPKARKVKWLVSLLTLILLAGVALATERFLIPEQANLPYWQRPLGISDDGIAVGVFYRPVEDVPPDFNFHVFFDVPRAFSSPLLVQGWELADNGPFQPPKHVELRNADGAQAVICLVLPPNGQALHDEFQTGTPFYIANLTAYRPVFGQADFYQETLIPNKALEVVAIGHLEDGTRFFVHTSNGTTVVHLGE